MNESETSSVVAELEVNGTSRPAACADLDFNPPTEQPDTPVSIDLYAKYR